MELVHQSFLKLHGKKLELITANERKNSYWEIKNNAPITIDDHFNIDEDVNNVNLLQSYVQKNYNLIPVRRKTSGHLVKHNPSFPPRVLLELTSQCNLDCVMCPRNVLERIITAMPIHIAKKCIDELDREGIQALWLYNIGESLLHPNIIEILNYCGTKKNLGSIWISTNGQRLTQEQAQALISSNITFINFSLNSMKAENYNKIAPKGNFEELIKNLNTLIEEKKRQGKIGTSPWIRLQMIEQTQVLDELDDFLNTYGTQCEMLSINKLEAFSQNVSQNINYAQSRERLEKKHCKRLERGDAFIFADGELSICDTDFNHKMSIGNVYQATIKEIWKSEKYKQLKNLNETGELNQLELCKNCLDYDL